LGAQAGRSPKQGWGSAGVVVGALGAQEIGWGKASPECLDGRGDVGLPEAAGEPEGGRSVFELIGKGLIEDGAPREA
jgi:hypothetical protein